MIGNDIIDRQAIRPRSPAHWERFREKTMTRTEQEFLSQYRTDQLDIWLAWAVKESVYKLEYQLRPKRYFAPKTIRMESLKRAVGKIGTYDIAVDWNSHYIHALAWDTAAPLKSIIVQKKKVELDDLIISSLTSHFPERTFRIEKNLFPRIKVDQKESWPLSKSHHGCWMTFAYCSL